MVAAESTWFKREVFFFHSYEYIDLILDFFSYYNVQMIAYHCYGLWGFVVFVFPHVSSISFVLFLTPFDL